MLIGARKKLELKNQKVNKSDKESQIYLLCFHQVCIILYQNLGKLRTSFHFLLVSIIHIIGISCPYHLKTEQMYKSIILSSSVISNARGSNSRQYVSCFRYFAIVVNPNSSFSPKATCINILLEKRTGSIFTVT